MSENVDFGVLYGQKTTGDALLIYSSYADSKASPITGDFIVLAQKDEDGIKYLARIEAEVYDEDPIFRSQDKTLIAVHYARIAERELSERDKQKMFSYTYNVKLLGTFEDKGKPIKFTTAVRKLPTVSYHARHLKKSEIDCILNAENENGAVIGYLCIGENIGEKKEILFDINKLKNKRTMVFAQSGFGKTNLVKVLIYNIIGNTDYGKLIFDLNGEYFLKSSHTNGLGDINEDKIRDNLVIYTDKNIPKIYINDNSKNFLFKGNINLNLPKDLQINDFMQISLGLTNAGKIFLEYIDSISNTMDKKEFIRLIFEENDSSKIRNFAYTKFSSYFETQKKENKEPRSHLKSMLGGVIRQLKSFKSIHKYDSKLVTDVLNYLKQGKTVIIDLSLKDSIDASLISTIIVKKLFEHNKISFTTEKNDEVINSVIFVEEAQNVISEEFVKSNANPFVRVAKEGRKFGIGLVAITQRPSAIAEEIRTQAENFFAFHMGNSDDIKALVKSNVNYSGVIEKFIQRETIPGNMYMVSSKQAFVLPVRVLEFEKLVEDKLYENIDGAN